MAQDDLEFVRQRIRQRMWLYKRFAVHAVLALGLLFLVILGGAAEAVGPGAAVVVVMGAMGSLVAHGLWLAMTELRARITQEEYRRAGFLDDPGLYETGKRKRDGTGRLVDDEGEMYDGYEDDEYSELVTWEDTPDAERD